MGDVTDLGTTIFKAKAPPVPTHISSVFAGATLLFPSFTSVLSPPKLVMKITGVTVLGMAAATQAFHVPLAPRTTLDARSTRASTSIKSSMAAMTDEEVKASLYEIGGYDVETGGKPFDPLNLCKYIPAATLRKYEVVHCRVAMLACVGYAFPQIFGMFDATDVTSANGIDALFQTAPEAWAQIVGACGVAEAAQWRHEQSGATTPFYDPFNQWPKTEKMQKKMQMMELKNGRAAMLCWASFLSAALIPGSVPDFAIPF